MPTFYPQLNENLTNWILEQRVFWTGTAPLVGKHINVSPKGVLDTSFTIINPNQAAYVDLTGSGAETISHLYENGRITINFNSFTSTPRILRLFCRGRVIESDHPDFSSWISKVGGEHLIGARAVIVLDIWKVQTSCGYGVPVVKTGENGEGVVFEDRKTIRDWCGKKVEKGQLGEYQRVWNRDSLDGLPGMRTAMRENGEWLWWGDVKAFVRRVAGTGDVLAVGVGLGALGMMATRWAVEKRIWERL